MELDDDRRLGCPLPRRRHGFAIRRSRPGPVEIIVFVKDYSTDFVVDEKKGRG